MFNKEKFEITMLDLFSKDENIIVTLINHYLMMMNYEEEENLFKIDILLNIYQNYMFGE